MNRDLFAYETEGENGVGATGVTFTIGADGKATTAVPREAAVEKSVMAARTVSPARIRAPHGRSARVRAHERHAAARLLARSILAIPKGGRLISSMEPRSP